MSVESKEKGSLFYIIPAEIMDDPSLNHAEKLMMGLLNGLAKSDGSCFCSNEWLSKKLGIKVRAVQGVLDKLEKNNYIKREVVTCASNPFQKIRTIYVCSKFKYSLRNAENCTSDTQCMSEGAENCILDMQKTAHIIDTRELIEEERESSRALAKEKGTSAPPAPPNPPPARSFFEQGKVKMEQEKFEKLCEEYGRSRVLDYVERVSDYAETNPKKFKAYACHAAVIRTWMKRDGHQKIIAPQSIPPKSSSKEEKNIFAEELERQQRTLSPRRKTDFEWLSSWTGLKSLQNQGKIICYKGYIEFPDALDDREKIYRYDEAGFREKVINTLIKMNVDVSLLKT